MTLVPKSAAELSEFASRFEAIAKFVRGVIADMEELGLETADFQLGKPEHFLGKIEDEWLHKTEAAWKVTAKKERAKASASASRARVQPLPREPFVDEKPKKPSRKKKAS